MSDDVSDEGRSPGWYPDDAGGQRWWDGLEWGERVDAGSSSRGRRSRLVATLVVLVAVVALGVVLAVVRGGDGAPAASPRDVAEDYLRAATDLDGGVGRRCELSTDRLRREEFPSDPDDCDAAQRAAADAAARSKQLDDDVLASLDDDLAAELAAQRKKTEDDTVVTVRIDDVDEHDDTATVEATETVDYLGDDPEMRRVTDAMDVVRLTVTLERSDGRWLVDRTDVRN